MLVCMSDMTLCAIECQWQLSEAAFEVWLPKIERASRGKCPYCCSATFDLMIASSTDCVAPCESESAAGPRVARAGMTPVGLSDRQDASSLLVRYRLLAAGVRRLLELLAVAVEAGTLGRSSPLSSLLLSSSVRIGVCLDADAGDADDLAGDMDDVAGDADVLACGADVLAGDADADVLCLGVGVLLAGDVGW